MDVETFTWGARVGDQGDVSFSVSSASFGDGYEQSAGNGLNTKSDSWPYTYIGPMSEIRPITDFLDAHGGSRSFLWTPPFGVQGRYKCAGYSKTPQGGPLVKLTATFKQTFAP